MLVLRTDVYADIRPELRRFVLYSLLNRLELAVTAHMVQRIDSLAAGPVRGSCKQELNGEMYALREYDQVVFMHTSQGMDQKFCETEINVPGRCTIHGNKTVIETEIITNSKQTFSMVRANDSEDVGFFDRTVLGSGPFLIRTRRDGDRFFPLGSSSEKKLQDFLVDEKYPLSQRDSLPLVERDGDIVWVAGLRISEKYRVHPDTDEIVVMRIIHNR
jgi:tRNA(Ile)-lysidine synthase